MSICETGTVRTGFPTDGHIYIYTYLVGGLNHLEKYELVNWKDYPIYEMENQTCLKPPTSI